VSNWATRHIDFFGMLTRRPHMIQKGARVQEQAQLIRGGARA
jgi:hypothetical protein